MAAANSSCIVFLSNEDGVLTASGDSHDLFRVQLFSEHFTRFPCVFIIFMSKLAIGAHAPRVAFAIFRDGKRHSRAA